MALFQKKGKMNEDKFNKTSSLKHLTGLLHLRQSDVALYLTGTAKQATLKQASFAAESDARNRLIRSLDSYIEGIFDEFLTRIRPKYLRSTPRFEHDADDSGKTITGKPYFKFPLCGDR